MASLLDLMPQPARVAIGDKVLEVWGISAGGIAALLARYPDLRKLMSGVEIDTSDLMAMGGDIVASIIAAGCGSPGNADAERIAGMLPVGSQADILGAILKETMPAGVGPLMEKLGALAQTLGLQGSEPVLPSVIEPVPQPMPHAVLTNGHDRAASTPTSVLQ
jgi:hypothetical protein